MGKCIKTGATIYIEYTNKWSRIDLFYDGESIFSNKNTLLEGKPPESYEIDVIVTDIVEHEKHFELINPKTTKSLHEYVNSPYKGYFESKFLRDFNPI